MPDLIDQMEHIRSKNNALWCEIIRIAIEEAPERTKKVLQVINDNDAEITSLLRKLSK